MGRWTDAPFVGGSYSDDTRPFSAQDTVNYMVVQAERGQTSSSSILRGVPGFSEIADTQTKAPIRKMANVEGLLLVVAGNKLFRVDTQFNCHDVGTIPGVFRVSMAHNQVAGGNQVAIANGQSGYVYNTVSSALTPITDDGFPGALTFDFVDGYITGIDPGRNFAFTSDLADATSYNTLDRYQAEGSPDKLVGQIVDHRDWWLFGERTIEPFQNTGESTGTFQRSGGTVIDVGAASPYAIVKMDNSFFWLGNDDIIYHANGYTPERISTMPVEQAISRCTTATAFAFTYEDRGHKIVYFTFQDGHTWGYDVATREWHRRQSKGMDRWRINDLVYWNGMWVAGDYANGKLYKLDWDVQSEAGEPLEKVRVSGVLADSGNAVIITAIELVIDTGLPPVPVTLFATGDVPDGAFNTTIDTQYLATGGKAPFVFDILSGALPTGSTMNSTGHVTGKRAISDEYTHWVVRVTDASGQTATLHDSCQVGSGVGPGLSDWKYFPTTLTDNTDRSAPGLDDSAWTIGTAPFGNLVKNPPAGQLPKEFDSRLSDTIATSMALNTRLWIRRKMTLISVPAGGFHLVGYFDNAYVMYINGVLASQGVADVSAGVSVDLPASLFTTGVNTIAIKCDDDAQEVELDTCYFDFLLDAIP